MEILIDNYKAKLYNYYRIFYERCDIKMETLVKLPMSLGLLVWKQLKKHGIEPRKTKLGIIDFSFKKEELDFITELKIVNPTSIDIEGISLLPNLKKLELECTGITAQKQYKMIASITDEEISEISQCTSLEELSIVNQAKISYVDVSRLSNLRVLEIHHNENLAEIIGLEAINGLWKIRENMQMTKKEKIQ